MFFYNLIIIIIFLNYKYFNVLYKYYFSNITTMLYNYYKYFLLFNYKIKTKKIISNVKYYLIQ